LGLKALDPTSLSPPAAPSWDPTFSLRLNKGGGGGGGGRRRRRRRRRKKEKEKEEIASVQPRGHDEVRTNTWKA
jgi:hypothetical protein